MPTEHTQQPSFAKLIGIGVLLLCVIYIPYVVALAVLLLNGTNDLVGKTGQFGDSFGALNAFVSSLTCVFLFITIRLQQTDVQASLTAFQHSVTEQQKEAKTTEKLMRAQLLRDRVEMYWRIYEPVTDAQVAELHLYPEEYMDRKLYEETYKTDDAKVRRYIYMSMLYEHLAFSFILRAMDIPDVFGHGWFEAYCTRLVKTEQFLHVHRMYRGYYPDFEKYIDQALGLGQ